MVQVEGGDGHNFESGFYKLTNGYKGDLGPDKIVQAQ